MDIPDQLEKYEYLDANCVRKNSNWGSTSSPFLFEKNSFDKDELKKNMKQYSPKLHKLIEHISDLDKRDMETDGRLYKHFIFSENKSIYGTKLIASALIANDWTLGYTNIDEVKNKKVSGKLSLLSDAELKKSKQNFYLLSSVNVYDKPLSTSMKKEILAKFNSRPDNVYGDKARIIVMDSGFKEGIDLFDIKYIHIFEPTLSIGDQRQVIGRGTRYCGQKGLEFHPTRGWPLHVFIYDLKIDENFSKSLLNTSSGIELYMKAKNINLRNVTLTGELERMVIYGAVDYTLTRNVHEASLVQEGGAGENAVVVAATAAEAQSIPEKFDFKKMRKYIHDNFAEYKWPEIKMENLCGYAGPPLRGGAGPTSTVYVDYTQTQAFIQNYFTPQNPIKGMLLNHSVGTGKTCTAIATASKSFEEQGYTILWVTRTTLKNDIWKNMFDLVCNHQFKLNHLEMGDNFKIPSKPEDRMKLLSKSWRIRPISYKQFSNLVAKKNAYYKRLVSINGEEDPLRKTLLIIDEAHKLYSGGDLSSIERPDMNQLHAALMNSYAVSGADSVKLLLMTATPIIDSPMELIQLINLCKLPTEQIETNIDEFSDMYLDENGKFTEKGQDMFLDQIAGNISYLNRERDARQFSQPIIRHVNIPLVDSHTNDLIEMFDKKEIRRYYSDKLNEYKEKIIETSAELDDIFYADKAKKLNYLFDKCSNLKKKTKCNKIVRQNIKKITDGIKDYKNNLRGTIKSFKSEIKGQSSLRMEKLKKIKHYIDSNKGKFIEYSNTPFFKLTNKCLKTVNDETSIKNYMSTHPTILEINEKLQKLDDDEKQFDLESKARISGIKAYIKDIKKTLRNKNLTENQRKTHEYFLNSEMKNLEKVFNDTKTQKKVYHGNASNKRKELEIKRKTFKKNLIKDIRKKIKFNKTAKKMEEKELKKLNKELNKVNVETNNYYKDIVKTYTDKIDEELSEYFEGEEKAAAAKVAAKEAKVAAAADAKKAKAAAAVAAKEAKAAAAAEAKKEKAAAKAAAAAAAKEAKAAAAAAAKEAKAAAAAAAKEAKAAAAAAKKTQKKKTKKGGATRRRRRNL